jgi:hypothetical protein
VKKKGRPKDAESAEERRGSVRYGLTSPVP